MSPRELTVRPSWRPLCAGPWAAALALILGCAKNGDTPGRDRTEPTAAALPEPSTICAQGETRECIGAGACKGGQACGAEGVWSACDCGELSEQPGVAGGPSEGGAQGNPRPDAEPGSGGVAAFPEPSATAPAAQGALIDAGVSDGGSAVDAPDCTGSCSSHDECCGEAYCASDNRCQRVLSCGALSVGESGVLRGDGAQTFRVNDLPVWCDQQLPLMEAEPGFLEDVELQVETRAQVSESGEIRILEVWLRLEKGLPEPEISVWASVAWQNLPITHGVTVDLARNEFDAPRDPREPEREATVVTIEEDESSYTIRTSLSLWQDLPISEFRLVVRSMGLSAILTRDPPGSEFGACERMFCEVWVEK
jgi:hypothetical protein